MCQTLSYDDGDEDEDESRWAAPAEFGRGSLPSSLLGQTLGPSEAEAGRHPSCRGTVPGADSTLRSRHGVHSQGGSLKCLSADPESTRDPWMRAVVMKASYNTLRFSYDDGIQWYCTLCTGKRKHILLHFEMDTCRRLCQPRFCEAFWKHSTARGSCRPLLPQQPGRASLGPSTCRIPKFSMQLRLFMFSGS